MTGQHIVSEWRGVGIKCQIRVPINFPPGRVYVDQDADDALIVRQCLEGHVAAFEALVTRYQRVMFTVAMRMLGEREDARDATQNAFIKVYEKLDTFDPAFRFFSWMYRILLNECLNAKRRTGRQPLRASVAEPDLPDAMLESLERQRMVRIAVVALPIRLREVIVLRHFAAQSYDEMSAAIGIPVKTVKSRLYTARQRLAEMLKAKGAAT